MNENLWFVFFWFGAVCGGLRNPLLEQGRDFTARMMLYGGIAAMGFFLHSITVDQCVLGESCGGHPIKVGCHFVSAFLIGCGGTGACVNFSQRGTRDDPDMQSFQYQHLLQQQQQQQPGGLPLQQQQQQQQQQHQQFMQPSPAMHASAESYEYEPVTVPVPQQGPMM